jgi:hypothetical protein
MNKVLACLYAAMLAGTEIAIMRVPVSAGGFWLTMLWAAWIASVVWALTRPSFSLLFAAVMAAMFLFVILPATEAQLWGHTTIAGNDYRAGITGGLQIAALAQSGMLAGAVAARTLRPFPAFSRLSPRLSPSRLDTAAWRSIVAGVVAVIAFSILGRASLRDFFVYTTSSGYGTFAAEASGNLGFLTAVQSVAGLALVLLPLRLGRTGPGGPRFGGTSLAPWAAPLLAAVAGTLVLLGGGQRGRFFVPVFAAGLVWLKISKRNRPPRRVAAAGVLVLIALGGLIGVAREAGGSHQITTGAVLAEPFGAGNDLFLPLAGLASIVPGQFPYLHGISYLQAAAFPIPRALWSGKPEDAMISVTKAIDPSDSGLAFPEFGEMYANFGMPGVLAGSLLLGALIELLAGRLAGSASIRESVFTAVCISVLLDLFTRGAIAPMLTSFAGLLVAAALVCRRRSAVLAEAGAPALAEPPRPGRPRRAVLTP